MLCVQWWELGCTKPHWNHFHTVPTLNLFVLKRRLREKAADEKQSIRPILRFNKCRMQTAKCLFYMFWRIWHFMVWELAPCCAKYFSVDLRCVGNAGIVEKRGGSSAGKARGGWILFTWGKSLSYLKGMVCLGQGRIDFWSGRGGQEVVTGCVWK